MQMVMTSHETEIQIFADWAMSHANRVTKDNRKNPEYPVQLNPEYDILLITEFQMTETQRKTPQYFKAVFSNCNCRLIFEP